jgi:hypothetical protein
MRNFIIYALLFVTSILSLSSCLGGDDEMEVEDWVLKNAQIKTFTVSNDSISALSSVVFTIDQINGKIFNIDSMPFGTVIDRKLICTLTYEVVSAGVQITQGDSTVFWNGTDSIDFSEPVIFTVYAYDGVTTKTYEAQINIHTVNPDSVVWTNYSALVSGHTFDDIKVLKFNDLYYMYADENGVAKLYKSSSSGIISWTELSLSNFPDDAVLSQILEYKGELYVFNDAGVLYKSENGQSWTPVAGAPVIKSLLGVVIENRLNTTSDLAGIALVNDELKFCSFQSAEGWKTGDEVPVNFPLTVSGRVSYEIMYYAHLIVASGQDKTGALTNKAWSTMDGLTWVVLTNDKRTFEPCEGAAMAKYDDKLFLMGGFDSSGNALDSVYYSKDNGVTWRDTVFFPSEFDARGGASLIVDDENFMLLFGGKVNRENKVLNELWRGRVNRLGFKND